LSLPFIARTVFGFTKRKDGGIKTRQLEGIYRKTNVKLKKRRKKKFSYVSIHFDLFNYFNVK